MLTEEYQHKQALDKQNDRYALENYYDSLSMKEQLAIAREAMNHAKSIVEKWEELDSEPPF